MQPWCIADRPIAELPLPVAAQALSSIKGKKVGSMDRNGLLIHQRGKDGTPAAAHCKKQVHIPAAGCIKGVKGWIKGAGTAVTMIMQVGLPLTQAKVANPKQAPSLPPEKGGKKRAGTPPDARSCENDVTASSPVGDLRCRNT